MGEARSRLPRRDQFAAALRSMMFNGEINPVLILLVLTNLVGLIWFAFSTQSTAKSAHRRLDVHLAEYEKELARRETAAALVQADRERYRADIDAKVGGLHGKTN